MYNLLLKFYDIQCDLFLIGAIDYNDFMALEYEYLKKYKLFQICLN